MTTTEDLFAAAVDEKIAEMKRVLHYNPSRFVLEIHKKGVVEAAKALVATGSETRIQSGFTQLALAGRLDLCIENLIVQPQFRDLFTPLERQEANRRIGGSGRRPSRL